VSTEINSISAKFYVNSSPYNYGEESMFTVENGNDRLTKY